MNRSYSTHVSPGVDHNRSLSTQLLAGLDHELKSLYTGFAWG